VLITTHGGTKKAFVVVIGNKQLSELNSTIERFGNASVSIFEMNGKNKNKIILLNCTKHLR
jgi:hypothetical protein